MNAFVLKNLRKRFDAADKDKIEIIGEAEERSSLALHSGKYTVVNININKFEKPVGAVVLSGAGNNINDINDVIEIKKSI